MCFKAPSGEQSQAQIKAFEDTWHWNESAERAFDEVSTRARELDERARTLDLEAAQPKACVEFYRRKTMIRIIVVIAVLISGVATVIAQADDPVPGQLHS